MTMIEARFASQCATDAVPPWARVILSTRVEPDVLMRIAVAANSTWTIVVGRWWRLAELRAQWKRGLRQSRGETGILVFRDQLAVQRRQTDELAASLAAAGGTSDAGGR